MCERMFMPTGGQYRRQSSAQGFYKAVAKKMLKMSLNTKSVNLSEMMKCWCQKGYQIHKLFSLIRFTSWHRMSLGLRAQLGN